MISRDGDRLLLSGPLTLETVKALYDGGLQANGRQHLIVDMSQVTTVDSAAVSLLLAWLREGQRSGVQLAFAHVPENLVSLARLYGVAELLPLSGG